MEPASAYHERAKQRVDADDFGEESYREALDRLIHGFAREARLTQAGEAAAGAVITGFLAMRLRLEAWFARHPDAADRPIAAPLIGLGLPRTGSSALACMLGEDRATRSLRTWESFDPFPPPGPRDGAPDPRIAAAEARMAQRAAMHPRLTAMLPSDTHTPTECQAFMAYDFKSQLFQAMAHLPSYVRWLLEEADLRPTYRLLKRLLQMLQYHEPVVQWRLKNPSHSIWIAALDEVFPDARFVMTHRAPASVIASGADLYLEYRSDLTGEIDLPALGRELADTWEKAMRGMIAFRDAGRDHRFCDIRFDHFQVDPLREIAALYDWLGEELTAETRAAMLAWRAANSNEVGQYARTPAAAFGLDPTALDARFRFYTERFGLDARPPQAKVPA